MGVCNCPAGLQPPCNMTHMLKTAAADVRSQLMREREARAQGSKGRGNAHFAAPLGFCLVSKANQGGT